MRFLYKGEFMNTKKYVSRYLKGILIGVSTLIPGVSGGTAAIILNEFENILIATSNFLKNAKQSTRVLLPLLLGAVTGVLLLSKPLNIFCNEFPIASKYVFVTISTISMILFIKSSILNLFTLKCSIFIVFGALIAFVISIITTSFSFNSDNYYFLKLFTIGLPLSMALVLPGISFSYMLFFFGLYEKVLFSIYSLDFIFLISLSAGIIVGTLIFTNLFLKFIGKYKNETYCFVLGFVVFSIINILL